MTSSELKAVRIALGDTQTQFGKRIGKSLRQVQNYEAGFTPIPETVKKLLEALGVL